MTGWDEHGRWRWGKAGQRRDEDEAEARRRRRLAARNREDLAGRARRTEDDRIAYDRWRHGLLSPAVITMALNAKGLYGPEVDLACGAIEPEVDLWEEGKLYPTWEQVQALAALCGVTPRFLTRAPGAIDEWDTSLRFHGSYAERRRRPRDRFTAKAIRARLGEL